MFTYGWHMELVAAVADATSRLFHSPAAMFHRYRSMGSSCAIKRNLNQKTANLNLAPKFKRVAFSEMVDLSNDGMADREIIYAWPYGWHMEHTAWLTGRLNWLTSLAQMVTRFTPSRLRFCSPLPVAISEHSNVTTQRATKLPFSTFRLPHSGGHFLFKKKVSITRSKVSTLVTFRFIESHVTLSFRLSLKWLGGL